MVHRNGRIGWSLIVVLVCVLAGEAVMVPAVLAEEPAIEVNSQEAVRQTLESQAGKRVKVKLLSGQDLDGKVAKVGAQALVLTELSGMEFFDATVRLDQVAAVIVRRGK
ncbi:MAG: hypothetical protein GDA65_10170 [Nitrospira sp. CR1.1]|nr:hypothetical protein [Nitrospira sp. CR1.1]